MKNPILAGGSRILSLLLVLAFLLSVTAAATETAVEGTATDTFLALMDYDRAVKDVEYLSQVIGPRPAGTASEMAAMEYVASVFEESGYELRYQDVPISSRSVGDISLGDLILAAGVPDMDSYYTAPEKAVGTAVYLDDPANVASLGEDLSGKIVFFPGNWKYGSDPDTYTAIAALDAAHAEGIVVMMDAALNAHHTYLPDISFSSAKIKVSTPVFCTAAMEKTRVPAYLAEYEGAEVTMERRTATQSRNVIGLKKAAVETDRTIYVTAHLDSVEPSPGANDNASGVAGVLALARAFRHIETNYNIQFMAFGAEEIGLVGSKYFTKNLTAEEIANAIGTYNMDMIATGDEECAYLCLDTYTRNNVGNDPSAGTHVGYNAWKAAEALGYDMDYCYVEYVGGADHVPFNQTGIPAVTFIWEVDQQSHDLEPYYHTAQDSMEYNFSREKLETTLDIVAMAVYNEATADYAAVVGEGVYREYYNTLAEAYEAAGETGTVEQLRPCEDPELKLGHTLNLAGDISVNFAVSKSALAGYDMDTVYVESTLEAYEGEGKTSAETVKLYPEEKGDYYYFTLRGLTAVQMKDRISSTLYGTKDGMTNFSPVDDYSIADYAYSQMNKAAAPASLKTLCADLLRYGTKAQLFKNYRTEALADGDMTEEQITFLSDIEAVTFGNTNTILEDLENAPIAWAGKSLSLDSKVCLKFIFDASGYTGDPAALTLRVAYENMEGESRTLELSAPELYNPNRSYYAFTLDALLAAELRNMVSVQVFEGETPLSCTLQYSADTYGNNKSGTLLELCKALFAYSDSAKAYFAG